MLFDNAINNEWLKAVKWVMDYGIISKPRGKKIREILGLQTKVDMSDPILSIPERGLGYKFMAAEAAWILSGDNRVSTIAPFSKAISQFSDDGITYHGAYGPKIRDQLHYAADNLAKDPDSRQAVINIWRENPGNSRDIPCTLSVQFLIRNEELHVIDTMRSSDLWLGWPYDIFNFSMLARYLILYADLDVNLGKIYLNAGSAHIYKPQWEACDDITELYPNGIKHARSPLEFKHKDCDAFVDALWEAAHDETFAP